MAISKQLQLHVKVNRDRAFDKRLKCDGFNKFVPPIVLSSTSHDTTHKLKNVKSSKYSVLSSQGQ